MFEFKSHWPQRPVLKESVGGWPGKQGCWWDLHTLSFFSIEHHSFLCLWKSEISYLSLLLQGLTMKFPARSQRGWINQSPENCTIIWPNLCKSHLKPQVSISSSKKENATLSAYVVYGDIKVHPWLNWDQRKQDWNLLQPEKNRKKSSCKWLNFTHRTQHS